jgi:hypothetical protein
MNKKQNGVTGAIPGAAEAINVAISASKPHNTEQLPVSSSRRRHRLAAITNRHAESGGVS